MYAGQPTLRILDLQTEGSSQLTEYDFGGAQPRWSPTGDPILFLGWTPSQGLWTMKSNRTELRELGIPSFSADWSPDGTSIVFNSAGEEQLLTANLDSSSSTLLVDNAPARCRYPRWAPDGSWIAYYRFEGREFGIWIVRPDGRDARLLIPDGRRLAWSPDGKQMVYEHLDRHANTYDLWVFSMETAIAYPLFADNLHP